MLVSNPSLAGRSEPVTDKHSEKSADAALVFGASSMQGWRVSMEDAHTAILNLDPNTPESERHGAPDDLHADGPPRMDVEAEAEAGRAAFAGGSSVPAALPDGSSSVTVGGDGKGGDSKARYSFFAVYDGHGGQAVAIEAGKRVHWKIIETEEFKRGDYAAAMQQGFLAMDEELQKGPRKLATGGLNLTWPRFR